MVFNLVLHVENLQFNTRLWRRHCKSLSCVQNWKQVTILHCSKCRNVRWQDTGQLCFKLLPLPVVLAPGVHLDSSCHWPYIPRHEWPASQSATDSHMRQEKFGCPSQAPHSCSLKCALWNQPGKCSAANYKHLKSILLSQNIYWKLLYL